MEVKKIEKTPIHKFNLPLIGNSPITVSLIGAKVKKVQFVVDDYVVWEKHYKLSKEHDIQSEISVELFEGNAPWHPYLIDPEKSRVYLIAHSKTLSPPTLICYNVGEAVPAFKEVQLKFIKDDYYGTQREITIKNGKVEILSD